MKRICNSCKQEKLLSCFGYSNDTKDGYKHSCKECRNKANVLYRKDHPVRCYTPATGTTKRCSICKETKSIENFGRNCCFRDGREYRCKSCIKIYNRKQEAKYKKNYIHPSEDYFRSHTKICPKCHKELKLIEFYRRKRGKGVITLCKSCLRNIRIKKWKTDKEYKLKAVKRAIRYNKTHQKQKSGYNKKYSEEHKSDRNKRIAHRKKTDIGFKILNLLQGRVLSAIKHQSTKKAYHTEELIGCKIDFLLKYIESKFFSGMTWENHGRGKGKWHIDHITPCASFDLTKPEEQKKCFHYTNMQPLWESDNIVKSSWYNGKLYRQGKIILKKA